MEEGVIQLVSKEDHAMKETLFPLVARSVTLGKLLNISEPWFLI